MKIKVMAILRSPELTADIGDIINVDEKTGNLLINAGAAELIAEEIEITIDEAVAVIDEVVEKIIDKDLKVELPEEPKPTKKGAFKK